MQQTTKYKLNLIERDDPFLPEALNANTQKVENALIAHEEGIEQRLTVLEGHGVAVGRFYGNSDNKLPQTQQTEQFIYLGFRPRQGAVWYKTTGAYEIYVFSEEDEDPPIRPVEEGFYARKYLNYSSYNCTYVFCS